MAERDLCAASGEYVFQLQAVQERKKFELVETLLGFVFGWWTFHHTAHDVHVDNEQAMRDLQLRIQRTRTNFEETSKQTESLMKKMMEMRQMNKDVEVSEDGSGVTRAGYLFLMEKKAFGTTWTKQYATYEKGSRTLTLLPYNQINVKAFSSLCAESMVVSHACALDDSERRAAWEARGERAGEADAWTLQAVSPAARAAWLHALSATRQPQVSLAGAEGGEAGHVLDENGFTFVRTIISTLEARGLTEQGLYRVAGVSSKVSRLVRCASNPRSLPDLSDPCQWESKTLTSALKGYLRALGSPLCTRRLHQQLIHAAKLESRSERVAAVHQLVHQLPRDNRAMLHTVVQHLCNVVAQSDKNLMSVSNVAVCFGPTLLRAEKETVASILEIKFYNVIVETLIENFRTIFLEPPPAVAEPVNGHARTSPAPLSVSRNDISGSSLVRTEGAWLACAAPPAEGGRFPPHQLQLLQRYPAAPAHRPPPPALLALRGVGRSSSSSAESVSSSSPPPAPPALTGYRPPVGRYTRVRTLYACLGESDGELSFEPNQIITNVAPSGEPGWLRGTLNGRAGLVPENYVEPLP